MIPTLRFVLTAAVLCLYFEAGAYQYNLNGVAADTIIVSQNYPKYYNQQANVTWEWNVKSGQWGVIFLDFDLDSGSESTDSYDWLKIDDGRRNPVIYSSHLHPMLPYMSGGPRLVIQFVSDGVSEPHTKGFKLQVLYGANERELHVKIHEATKQEKESTEGEHSTLMIIWISTLVVLVLVITGVVVILVRRNKRARTGGNRNIFGVRRNSGISHSRRSSPTDEQPPNQQQLQPQQQRRVERPVQRSNSQLNWMARAELATSLQKTGCTPRPNAYTRSDTLTNVGGACSKLSATTSRKGAASNGLRVNHTTRSYESSLNEYSDTVDSIYHPQEREQDLHDDDMLDCELPTYEESFSSPMALQYSAERGTSNASNCYQNAWPGTLLQENQTNIYINTAATPASKGSIKEITIDNSKCIIKSTCSANPEAFDKSAANAGPREANTIVYQNCSTNAGQKDFMLSESSVQIIDGYAFIVPSSTNEDNPTQPMVLSREQSL